MMADSVQTSYITEYLDDLILYNGRVRLSQRPPHAGEVGRPMRDLAPGLIVRVHRGGETIGFREAERAIVQPGVILLDIEASSAPPSGAMRHR